MDAPLPDQKPSRKLLYIPFILFGIIAVLWSGGWFFAKGRAEEGMDRFFAQQKLAGRIFACPDRQISGFPFRFAVFCGKPAYEQTMPDGRVIKGSLEAFTAYARIYAPTHLIAEAKGPLRLVNQDGTGLTVTWASLEASYQGTLSALSEVSVQARAVAMTPVNSTESLGAIEKIEAHIRSVPDKPEGNYALAVLAEGAQIPELNAYLETPDAARLELQASADKLTQIDRRDVRVTLENWRKAGGRANIALFKLAKGRLVIDAKGDVGLDDERRPQGRIDTAIAGAEQLLAKLGGRRQGGGVGGVLGGLLGGNRQQQPARSISIPLPLRLENGRALLGPFPLAQLKPLY